MRKILIALVLLSSVFLSLGIKAGLAQESVNVLTHGSFELLDDSGSNADDGGADKGGTEDKGGGGGEDEGGEGGEGGEGEDFPVLG